ncbi:MAG: tRNA pseudouridine(55) synthase TruB [Bacteriovoracaceae bacterium]
MLNGIIYLNKPKGISSSDAFYPLKKLLKKNGYKNTKIGHYGTLDPFATGLLLVAIGPCTRLADFVHEESIKTYLAKGIFGSKTSTGDYTGEKLRDFPLPEVLNTDLLTTKFQGEYWQIPPAVSAAKHQGKALYEWVREGVIIQKAPVRRFIHELNVLSITREQIKFEASVSTGTYIRTLMEDIAAHLGSGGHLQELSRIRIGEVSINEALREIPSTIEELKNCLHSPTKVLPYAEIQLTTSQCEFFRNGREIVMPEVSSGRYWAKGHEGELLGLAEFRDGSLRVLVNMMQQGVKNS